MRKLLRWMRDALAVVGGVTLLGNFCFLSTRAVSDSMKPTLRGESWDRGDQVLIERISYRLRRPRRWEVIAYRCDNGDIYLKRVLACPGETLQLYKDGRMLIDGREVEKPSGLAAIRYFPVGNIIDGKPFLCDGGYYVMGDDSYDSDDSRFNGAVPEKRVLGRVWLVLWPRERLGRVHANL